MVTAPSGSGQDDEEDEMVIRIGEYYELRSVDSMNWRLYELREIKSGPRSRQVEWEPCGYYCQNLDTALEFLWQRELRLSPLSTDLEGAIVESRRIASSLSAIAVMADPGLPGRVARRASARVE